MRNRNIGIQLIRCIACIMIMLHHLSAAFEANLLDTLGRGGVGLFIAISGILCGLYKNPEDYSELSFKRILSDMKKRIKKFYWIYFIFFLVGIAAIIMRPDMRADRNIFVQITAFLLIIQAWFPDEGIYFAINPVCWYMSLVVFFALCEPIILKVLCIIKKRIYKYILILLFVVLLVMLTLSLGSRESASYVLYIFPLTRLCDYICAILVGNIIREYGIVNHNGNYNIKYTVVEIASLVLLIISMLADVPIVWQYNVFYLLIGIIVVGIFSLSKGYVTKLANNALVIRFADISYIIFIIHQLTYMVIHMINKVVLQLSTPCICILALIITVVEALIWEKLHNIFSRQGWDHL